MELIDLQGSHKLWCINPNIKHPTDDDRGGIAVSLGEDVYFFFEDNNDGYRSQMAPILKATGSAYEFWEPDYIRRDVLIQHIDNDPDSYHGECDYIKIIDAETAHIWAEIGSKNIDDYYPWFVCNFYPIKEKNNE